MEVGKIMNADFLDILFEGRNKEYGAYELRRKYNKRLTTAILITAALALLILLASFVADLTKDRKGAVQIQEVQLEEVKIEEPKNEPPPPPPPPKPPEPPKVEMTKFTPPKIVKDDEVKEDEKPPEIEKLEETKISTVTQEGIKDEGIVAPPVEDAGVVEAPKKDDTDYDQTFTKVEIEAEFPGGDNAWNRYITREINRYIDELQEDGRAGTCVVQFIVDKDGNISNVEALTMKGTKLAEIASNAIRKGPKWKPAQQNGRTVKAYRKQPITFQLMEE